MDLLGPAAAPVGPCDPKQCVREYILRPLYHEGNSPSSMSFLGSSSSRYPSLHIFGGSVPSPHMESLSFILAKLGTSFFFSMLSLCSAISCSWGQVNSPSLCFQASSRTCTWAFPWLKCQLPLLFSCCKATIHQLNAMIT